MTDTVRQAMAADMPGTVDVSILNQHFRDLNPLVCGWQACLPGHAWGPAARDYFLIHYIRAGRGSFERQGVRHELGSGALFLIRPEELVSYQAANQDPWQYIWIGFDGSLCPDLLEKTALARDQSILVDHRLGRIFAEIQSDVELQPAAELYLCAKLFELFAVLHRKPERQSVKNEYVRRATDYIKANYAQSVRIDGIARLIGIDRRYLCRIFAAETGQTPRDYLMHYRLQRAAYYLTERDYTVQEAARSVGYEDTFNFSKAFKQHFGLAPQHYRQHNR